MVCHVCVDHVSDYVTRGCVGLCGRQRLWTFENVEEFMTWLLGDRLGVHRRYTFLAHNLKGYDAYPILEWCVKKCIVPECLYRGAKVMSMVIEGIDFKDSVCFIPMRLSAFPATFGTKSGDKGYFPHFFNTKANVGYVGEYPPLEYYGIDDMREEEQQA
ncbi:uncharacterized protein LOC116309040 [Actinia tenebrosa]|uniref:DNA-directed DNA polymerase n=1 Tax=Actinia tenebrosa TaxID=6105 RepID=A0A6P8JGQ7_ACTTE|nr:uncharacterized protein LOC116309040 [Actinia tenebrosa]